jgi:GH15 family glucan-1,4-alpha-glucosidase
VTGTAGRSGYLPVSEHGLIGDLHSVALVGTNGTIDWHCSPSFDAPSMFGSLLDADRGGSFELAAAVPAKSRQFYRPDTNVLITRFFAEDGVGEIQDFMPVGGAAGARRHRLIRRVLCVRGTMPFRAQVSPRFGYGLDPHALTEVEGGVVFTAPSLTVGLSATVPVEHDDRDVTADFKLAEGESAVFALDEVGSDAVPRPCSAEEALELLAATAAFWQGWLSASRYRGRWREVVHRSALTLKLLTYAPTGAIVAAPTTSLPEQIGGERNWDYRYVWVRDAAFCVYALLRLGFTSEADAFAQFILGHAAASPLGAAGPMQVMLCDHWDQPDEGIWETRGGPRKFLYSQLMCWVAMERAIRLAIRRGLPADLERWRTARDAIYRRIMDRGWSPRLKAFTQYEGGDVLDASVLLMPLVKFIAPTDPKWLSTLDALTATLVSDSLVYRYDPQASPDGVRGQEGTFSACSFWYVEALTRAGRLEEARLAFEKMLSYANHLGLYAEEISRAGEQQGNFPQALTHLALISAAFNLDRALG